MSPFKPSHAFGLHRVEWREVGEKPTIADVWPRNKTRPRVGERRWANATQCHQTPIGGRVWLLYQSASAYFNGVDADNHQLDKWVIVEGEVLRQFQPQWSSIAHAEVRAANPDLVEIEKYMKQQGAIIAPVPDDEYQGWIEVLCHRVIGLRDIPDHFALSDDLSELILSQSANVVDVETADLAYIFTVHSSEGVFEWKVVTKNPAREVLSCFEVAGSEPFEIYNRALPEDWFD